MIDPYDVHEYFVPCPSGVQDFLAEELKACGARSVRPLPSGAACQMKLEAAYRACLWSRVASRVLFLVGRIKAANADELYEGAKSIAWEDHVAEGKTIAIFANGVSDELRNTQFTAVRVKDAICDHLRDVRGSRPDVDPTDPDVRINVSLRGDKASIAIDFAGESLHRRGYRSDKDIRSRHVEAPMKENLAAAMLAFADWEKIAQEGGRFVDPMCGSGTLAIEAAMIAGDRAPGLLRQKWGFEGWAGHNEKVWETLIDEADHRAEAGSQKIPAILAADKDPHAIEVAGESAKRAGLSAHIQFRVSDIAQVAPLSAADKGYGLVAFNPPYGERLETRAALPDLYALVAKTMQARFEGYALAIITPDPEVDIGLARVSSRQLKLFNGPIETFVHVYDADAERMPTIAIEMTSGTRNVSVISDEPTAFVNRLKKNQAKLKKWLQKEQVNCFRVYDADIPQYNVVIDLYEGVGTDQGKRWLHIAEYAPPKEIEPEKSQARLTDVVHLAPLVLDIDPSNVFLKVRKRDRGGSQYANDISREITGTISEGGLLFEVNLSDRLDTGIFLDQRITRDMLRSQAKAKRFLNLFAYTGTASVYAAAGGAFSTTTVDLSNAYLDWTKRNFELNKITDVGFGDGLKKAAIKHELVRADSLSWIREVRRTGHRWDLIFLDPPTFSNSAKMHQSWDVTRDHAELIIATSFLLTREGELYFSCNKRGFKLHEDSLHEHGLAVEDITGQTVSPDFERSGGGHRCWRISRGE